MIFSLGELCAAGGIYLILLYAIAHLAERGSIPSSLIRHPVVHVLSLGVFAGSFALFGVIGVANEFGYSFLAYYGGISAAFLFSPLLLQPLLRLCRIFQLSSLADILTFRFRSQWAGAVATLFMLFTIMPLLALQIEVITESVEILSGQPTTSASSQPSGMLIPAIFCGVMAVFTILVGSRHITAHEQHQGLVATIAFESLFKLVAITVVGGVALFGVFGGSDGLDQWLSSNPKALDALNTPLRQDTARSLLVIFFSAAVTMPHLFHMLFAENTDAEAMRAASWGMPLYLLLLALPILPILWAGQALGIDINPSYYALALGITTDAPWLSLTTFIGGLSAASGGFIVTTLAVASMILNHLILPFYQPGAQHDIYRWLLWTRRLMIFTIIATAYLFYFGIHGQIALADLLMSAFIGTLQFLPGILATLYWPKANRNGFLSGFLAGSLVWFVTLLLPIISSFNPEPLISHYLNWPAGQELWTPTALLSLGTNAVVFALVSWICVSGEDERMAAELCATDDLSRPVRQQLTVRSPAEFREQLAKALGSRSADREVGRAMSELRIREDENRPGELRKLRRRLEINLSGLLGPTVAMDIMNRLVPYLSADAVQTEDINLIEARLEGYHTHLTGLAADLDALRRRHRQTLEELPIGVCALGQDNEVLMWNRAMEELSKIPALRIVGSDLDTIPAAWRELISRFIESPAAQLHKQQLNIDGQTRWLTLHKGISQGPMQQQHDSKVIVVEDITENRLLEEELTHSERLASIGRLAAGVAHEIGNPVTGIACLAQNLHFDTDNPESLATADEILKQTDRITKIVQTLVSFSHAGSSPGVDYALPTQVNECVDEAIHLLQLNKDAKQVEFVNNCPAMTLVCDSQRLLQIFVNLLGNARDASDEGSSVEVFGEQSELGLTVSVRDSGHGINSEDLEQIFEPFFTTKEPGQGTGLGLALVYSIIEDFGGSISAESPPLGQDRGTRFVLKFPPSTAS